MKLGIDIDGCLANFTHAFGDLLISTTGENKLPDNWRTSENFPATWNWHYDAGYTPDQVHRVWVGMVEGGGKFWRDLPALPTAEATIKQLDRLSKAGHEVYFLTHRSGKKAKQQTENWLIDHGMTMPTVLLTGNKLPVMVSLELDFFIDDKLATVNEIYRHYSDPNAPKPANSPVILLKDAPYNWRGRVQGLRSVHTVEEGLREIGLWSDVKRGRPKKEKNDD